MKNAQARRNMITQQVRAWNVLDNDVLDLLFDIHREDFIPEAYRNLAFADMNTPIGEGEVMLPPKEEGKILQALDLLPTETVLEIGTGVGYLTALMARCANHIYSVDCKESFTKLAKQHVTQYKLDNVTLETGDAAQGWAKHAPYDVIVITGSLPRIPQSIAKQVNVDGRIFAIVGDAPAMQAVLLTRLDQSKWQTDVLYETVLPRLHGIKEIESFEF